MMTLNEFLEKRREQKRNKRAEYVKRRSKEIFSIEEYDGQLWLFCDETGIFPCSYLGLKTETEMLKLLNDVRNLYIETETKDD